MTTGSTSTGSDTADILDVLSECGYEPYQDGDTVLLRNCPFHALAQSYPELVCSMNLQLLTGLVEGLGCPSVEPQLAPDGIRCRVRLVVGQ